ncbi:MAG: hypothetical protein IJL17_15580 [Kiritimatiellae bacterium]|nr:hypothetical protein [Kiritimatiellia bacterium]
MKKLIYILSAVLLGWGCMQPVFAATSKSNAPVVPPPVGPHPPPGPGGGGGGSGGGGGKRSGLSGAGDPICYVDGSVMDTATDVRVRCPDLDLVFKRAYVSTDGRIGALGLGWTHSYDLWLEPAESNRVRVCRSADMSGAGWVSSVTFPEPPPGGTSLAESGVFRLRRQEDGRWAFQTPDLLTYCFSADSNLTSIAHASGATVTLVRENGILTRVEHSCGKALSFGYVRPRSDAPYLLSSVGTPDPDYAVRFSYHMETNVCRRAFWLLERVDSIFHGQTNSFAYAYSPDPSPGKTYCIMPQGYVPQTTGPGGELLCACPPPVLVATHYVLTEKTDSNGFRYWYDYMRETDGFATRCGALFTDNGYLETQLFYKPGLTVEKKPTAFGTATLRLSYDDRLRETRRETADEARIFVYDEAGDEVGSVHTNVATAAWSSVETAYGGFHNATGTVSFLDGRSAGRWTTDWHEGLLIPRRRVSPEGRVRELTLDGHEIAFFPAGVSCPSGSVRFVCSDGWRPLTATDANGSRASFSYDTFGYVSLIASDGLPSVGFTRDALGNVASVSLPGPDGERVTSYERNRRGNPIRIVHPDGADETFAWNGNGTRVTEHVDRAGRRDVYEWVFGHPLHAGRVVDGVTNRLWSVAYDRQLNVVAISDPLGRQAETYVLDENERVVAATNLEGQAMSRTYLLGNLVASELRFDGTAVAYSYDGASNLERVEYPDAVLAYDYDGDGLLVSASNSVGVVSNAYGEATGWLASMRGADGTEVSFAYHPGGEVASVSSVAGTTEYVLDAANRRAQIVSPAGTFRFGYNAWNGRIASVTNASGLVTTYAYDVLDRVTNIAWAANGVALGGFSYVYDTLGRIVSRRYALGTNAFDRAYSYDCMDRLASDGDMAYAYDAAGNRLSMSNSTGIVSYAYGAGDRLASWTGGLYVHDAAGCVTRIERDGRPTLDLTWDSQYQLVSVSTNGAFAEGYAYDALGRRVSTTTLEGTVRHVYDDGWQCIADVDGNGNVLCSYVWGEGIDKLLAVKVGNETYTALTDIQGTVWGYVDSQNNIVARWTYDAWGNVLSENVTTPALATLRYRFQGREWSAVTGLTNFRMRWYDPVTGRWLSKDPIGLGGGLNLYTFCRNDAVNRVDLIGNIPWLIGAGIGGLIGGLVGGITSAFNGKGFWSGAIAGAIGGVVTGATFGMASAAGLISGLGTGAAWGAGTGALGGAATGITEELLKPSDECFDWGNVGSSAFGGAVGGALGGGLVGVGGKALTAPVNLGSESLITFDASLYSSIGVANK